MDRQLPRPLVSPRNLAFEVAGSAAEWKDDLSSGLSAVPSWWSVQRKSCGIVFAVDHPTQRSYLCLPNGFDPADLAFHYGARSNEGRTADPNVCG